MAETYKGGRGVVESIEIGRARGSPMVGSSPPMSTIHVTEEQAKSLSRGDEVRIVLQKDGDAIPEFKNREDRDRWLAKRRRDED